MTVKPLYGHQEGAVKGYNPHQTVSPYRSPGLWELLGRLAAAGRIRSVVTRVGGSEDVPTLQRAMQCRRNRGKIVARFAPDP